MMAAEKNVKIAGGDLASSFRVVDVYKENRHLKPRSITFLDSDGQQIALVLAEKIVKKVDGLLRNQ